MTRPPGRLLVLGASGMLGRSLVAAAERRGLEPLRPARQELDLERPEEARAAIERLRPGAVVNAAAWTDVAGAERPESRERVYRLNRDGPRALAEVCRDLGALLVHLSTDYVFDGTKGAPYVEEDRPNPLQVYGRSKLEGEEAILAAWSEALVVRSSTLYGPGPRPRPHYVDAILDQAARGGAIEVVETPVASPTYTVDLAEAILDLLASGRRRGVVHVVNAGFCSRLELARAAVEAAGLSGAVRVVGRPEPPGGLRRPAYSVLSTARLEGWLGRPLRSWSEALRAYVRSRGGVGSR